MGVLKYFKNLGGGDFLFRLGGLNFALDFLKKRIPFTSLKAFNALLLLLYH